MTEAPIETYEHKKGAPYLVDLMDIRMVYGRTDQEPLIKSIDQYVIAQISELGLKSTRSSYESVVSKLEAKLEVDPNLDYPERIDKLAAYVSMLRSEQLLKQMRSLTHA